MHLFPLEALHRCAEIYNFLELPAPLLDDKLGIFYGHGISEWKKEIERTGKKVIGGYLRTETDTWDASLDFASVVGMEYMIIHVDYFPTLEILREKCRMYNEFGAKCKKKDLKLLYENHFHEWQILDGKTVFEQLMEYTEPEYLSVQLNQYWLLRGLVNPLKVLEKYHDRVEAIVQEDYPLEEIDKFNMWKFYRYHPIAYNIQYPNVLQGNEIENILPVQCELFTEIGDGMIAHQPLVDLAVKYPNIKYVILKQDYTGCKDEFDSIRRSAENYKAIPSFRRKQNRTSVCVFPGFLWQ